MCLINECIKPMTLLEFFSGKDMLMLCLGSSRKNLQFLCRAILHSTVEGSCVYLLSKKSHLPLATLGVSCNFTTVYMRNFLKRGWRMVVFELDDEYSMYIMSSAPDIDAIELCFRIMDS